MKNGHDSWVRTVLRPARRLEPTEAEVARALAAAAAGGAGRGRASVPWTSRGLALAVLGALLAATAAAAVGLLPLGELLGEADRGGGGGSHVGGSESKGPVRKTDLLPSRPYPVERSADARGAVTDPPPWDDRIERAAAEAVLEIHRRMAVGTPEEVCDLMGPPLQRRNRLFTQGGLNTTCEQVTGAFMAFDRSGGKRIPWRRIEVLDVTIEGPRRAWVTSRWQGRTTRAPVRKVGGRWKVWDSGRSPEL